MKVILIFLVILHFSRSVISSFAGDISRRIKIPRVYSFKELVRAMEEGKPLVPGIGKFVVPSPLGNRDLSHLNDVAAHYQGEDTLYWLALLAFPSTVITFPPWSPSIRQAGRNCGRRYREL